MDARHYDTKEISRGDTAFTATSLADIGNPIIGLDHEYDEIIAEVSNTGQALTDFAILIRPVAGGTWQTLISGATDWDSNEISIKPYVSDTGIATLASGGTEAFRIMCGPVAEIKFQASIASGTTSITITGKLVHGYNGG
jgi:hypothetical protein